MPSTDDLGLRREFSRKLREVMEEKGWTQTELAKRVGLTQGAISDMVRVRKGLADYPAVPRAEHLLQFCKALGVSADWMLGLSSNPRGGAGTPGQEFQEGGMRAILDMRVQLEAVEARWRGTTALS